MNKQNGFGFYVLNLIDRGFFDSPVTSKQILDEICCEFGKKFPTSYVAPYLNKLLGKSLRSVKKDGKKFWVHINVPKEQALRVVGAQKQNSAPKFLSADLRKKLGKDFDIDLNDLELVYDKSGTCTAFLLRKILEKAIYLVFAKHNRMHLLQGNSANEFVGLEKMIRLAAENKINNLPILTPKTTEKIQGIKFLGDTSAHNPLVNVKSETIELHLPFIITAYEELAQKL